MQKRTFGTFFFVEFFCGIKLLNHFRIINRQSTLLDQLTNRLINDESLNQFLYFEF